MSFLVISFILINASFPSYFDDEHRSNALITSKMCYYGRQRYE